MTTEVNGDDPAITLVMEHAHRRIQECLAWIADEFFSYPCVIPEFDLPLIAIVNPGSGQL
jgi:hypothetical protein